MCFFSKCCEAAHCELGTVIFKASLRCSVWWYMEKNVNKQVNRIYQTLIVSFRPQLLAHRCHSFSRHWHFITAKSFCSHRPFPVLDELEKLVHSGSRHYILSLFKNWERRATLICFASINLARDIHTVHSNLNENSINQSMDVFARVTEWWTSVNSSDLPQCPGCAAGGVDARFPSRPLRSLLWS